MLSRIQNDRPCVPTTRSSPLIARSRIDVAGMFNRSESHVAPSSSDTYTACSVPANSSPPCCVSSRTVLTMPPSGMPWTISVHVFPRSVVFRMCGLRSSSRNVLTAAYAVFALKCEASIIDTFAHGPNEGGVTLVHAAPPFDVTWINPSSVPAQMREPSIGDGASV